MRELQVITKILSCQDKQKYFKRIKLEAQIGIVYELLVCHVLKSQFEVQKTKDIADSEKVDKSNMIINSKKSRNQITTKFYFKYLKHKIYDIES